MSTINKTSSLSVSSQASSSDYRCRIFTSFPSVMNYISTIVTVINAFCAPIVLDCSGGDMLDDFVLVGESLTQINNLATGCAASSYDNRTQYSVSLVGNNSYFGSVSTQYSSSETFAMWIDFDDNCIFSSSERVAYMPLTSTSDTTVAVTIPSIGLGAATGIHRMRATVAYSVPPLPCGTSGTLGEIHDYSVNILASIRK